MSAVGNILSRLRGRTKQQNSCLCRPSADHTQQRVNAFYRSCHGILCRVQVHTIVYGVVASILIECSTGFLFTTLPARFNFKPERWNTFKRLCYLTIIMDYVCHAFKPTLINKSVHYNYDPNNANNDLIIHSTKNNKLVCLI